MKYKEHEAWQLLELEKVSRVVDSLHKTPKFTDSGYPMVRAADVKGGFLDLNETKLVSEKDFLDFTRNHKPQQGDIVLSRVGSYFNFSYNKNMEDFCIGQNTSIIVPKIESRFLYYSLISPFVQDQVERSLVGTSQKTLSLKYIRELKIPTPSISIQRRIADILAVLDEKIELNRQTNATLEAIAQSIFREWFVEFNYPNATGEMVESELGMLPKGWKVLPLDDIADFLNGLALQKFPAENEKDYLPVIKIRELKNGVSNSSDKASRNIQSKYIINDGDLIFSWSGTLEVKFWVGGEGALNQHLFKVTSKEYPLWFCYFWILEHLANFRGIAEDKTTTMGHIQRHHLSEALCYVPDNLTELDKVMKPLMDKIINLEQQSATLASLRDALLPKLMSGEMILNAVS